MNQNAPPRPRRKAIDAAEPTGFIEKVGYMMGKLEGIETRLDQTEKQQARMETKIDGIPSAIRDAVKPLVESARDHDARILALENAELSEKSISSWRAKAFGSAAGLFGIGGTLAAIWEAFHPGK